MGYCVNPDKLLGVKVEKDFCFDALMETNEDNKRKDGCIQMNRCLLTAREQKYFESVENAASEILYRCIDCRECTKGKNGERIEMLSIKEEVEQDLINRTVKVDVDFGVTIARLPLLEDPSVKLAQNKGKVLAVYESQLKRLAKSEKDKMDVIEAEAKLQNMGHVCTKSFRGTTEKTKQ